MKVYVAGRFTEKLRVRSVMDTLEADGHEITSDWTNEEDNPVNYRTDVSPEIARDFYMQECAEKCVQGVLDADVVLALNHPTAGGMFVEVGMAIAYGKKIIVVGPKVRDTPFWYLQGITHAETDEEAIFEVSSYEEYGTEYSPDQYVENPPDSAEGEFDGRD